ncbi:MAG: tripartite tricarboxylate transporter permease [Clostridium sp.]
MRQQLWQPHLLSKVLIWDRCCLTSQPVYMYTVFVAQVVVNIIMVIVAVYIAKIFAKILSVPYSMLGTIIVMLSVIGAYSYMQSSQ